MVLKILTRARLIRATRFCCAFVALSSAVACDFVTGGGTQDRYREVSVVNGRTVIDSGIWAMPTPDWGRIYWLDDQHVIFSGQESLHFMPFERPMVVRVWNYKTGELYRLGLKTSEFCYADGKVIYAILNEAGRARIGTAVSSLVKMGARYQLQGKEEIDSNRHVVDFNCNVVPRPGQPEYVKNSDRLREYGMELRPIESEDPAYSKNRRLGIYDGESLLKTLPIREHQLAFPTYSSFNDAYLLSVRYQPDKKEIGSMPWPEDVRAPVWILNSDLRLEKWLLPEEWPNSRQIPFLLSKAGIVASGYIYADRASKKTVTGLYLLKNNRVETLVKGFIVGGETSPDGCSFAFTNAPSQRLDRQDRHNQRTLKIIELCKNNEGLL